MKILTLQITADNFESILQGKQKVETRYCYSSTLVNKYFDINPDNDGLDLKEYDALRLINGRSKPTGQNPELIVEVIDKEVEIFLDENGEEVFLEDVKTGEWIQVCRIYYRLGNVLESKNLENFNPNRKTLNPNFVTIEEFEKIKKLDFHYS